MPVGYSDEKAALLRRLARIEGQVRGLGRMVEEDRYCIDVLTQIAAVNTALNAVGKRLLDAHVQHCVKDAFASGSKREAEKKSRELLDAVERFSRTR
jgi:CsoR family transcriptional regulator, copper-sensing transcriptional repressor